jgi:ribonuclease P protein component
MMGVSGARPRAGRVRLSRSADFDRVFRHGRSHAGRELVLYVFPRGDGTDAAESRLGLSVSRKVGGAVQRNRVKRLLREAFDLEGGRLPAGTDAVVVARHEVNALAEREGLAGIRRALSQLLDRVAEQGASRSPGGSPNAAPVAPPAPAPVATGDGP